MSVAHHRRRPQHLAGARHRPDATDRPNPPQPPVDFDDIPIDFDFDRVLAEPAEEIVPPARVKQSALAFAVAVTLAALPLLVLDNFTAQADSPAATVSVDAAQDRDEAAGADDERGAIVRPTTTIRVVTSEVPVTTATTAATSTTVAPTTTAAPTTTVSPPTTKAPVAAVAAPTTTTTAAPAATSATPGDPNDPASWDALARCESNGNWAANTGNGYYGGLQFSVATWQDLGGTGYPHQAAKATQIQMGKRLHDRSGWDAWPGCARKLGWT